MPTPGEFYLPHTGSPTGPFHTTAFLPSGGLLPPFPAADLGKPQVDAFHIRNLPGPMDQLSLRLSPVSNTQSVSPQRSDTRIHSTVENSTSDNSDDEDIDVVRSAFVPIKPASVLLQQEVQPDSTVQDKEPSRPRNELKAPSSRKSLVLSPKSPSTKLHASGNAAKSVWRPY